MKVAAIQMRSGTRTEDNLRAARALLEDAAAGGAELAVLPEYFSIMEQRSERSLLRRQKNDIWAESGMSPKAPAAFSSSTWVLDTLLQAMANSSMEAKSRSRLS